MESTGAVQSAVEQEWESVHRQCKGQRCHDQSLWEDWRKPDAEHPDRCIPPDIPCTGRLISRDFKLDLDGKSEMEAGLIKLYHKMRIEYAERHRNDEIPINLRTGDDAPTTVNGLIWAILRLGG